LGDWCNLFIIRILSSFIVYHLSKTKEDSICKNSKFQNQNCSLYLQKLHGVVFEKWQYALLFALDILYIYQRKHKNC